jgi:transposase-like protein
MHMEGMGLLDRLVKWIEERKIFLRKRKSDEQRALGMLLYHSGLSYEKTSMFVGASHEAVREWYQKGRELFGNSTRKKRRVRIAVDEKEIRVNGVTIYIWAAVDLANEHVIATWVSFGRSCLEALIFLEKVKCVCKGELPRVFIDGGKWYPWALERLGFDRYTIVRFGPRSAIERFFGDVEWRIRRFWNGFHGGYNTGSMSKWIESFAGFRNYVKISKEALS